MSFLPGWDSVDATETIAHNLHIAAVVVLGILFLAEGMALIYDFRNHGLSRAVTTAAEDQRQRDAEAAEARRKTEVEGLQKRLADADKKVAALEEKDMPRHLSDDQRRKLIEFLTGRPAGGLTIKANVTAKDARHYADEIADAIRSAGWTVNVDNAMFLGSTATGFWVTVMSADAAPIRVVSIHDALQAAGLPIDPVYRLDRALLPDEVWLSVSFKN